MAPKTSQPVNPAIDPNDELLTTAQLADLFQTTEKALRVARNKRKSWMPKPRYLGARVLYLKSEALACLRTAEEVAA
jgi:hypothetical protein